MLRDTVFFSEEAMQLKNYAGQDYQPRDRCDGFTTYTTVLTRESDSTFITIPYPIVGEWHSRVISPNSSILCFKLDFYSPNPFKLNVDLLTGDTSESNQPKTTTVYNISDFGGTQFYLLTELSLGFEPVPTSQAQVVVYMSTNMVINNAEVMDSRCQQNYGQYSNC